ncbi:Signal transduction histidine kinase [Caballeronia sordidicola]|uniref:Signal transduction histidine kinase n=1 Tax=Caballeronia sordidicola TaxID=196367 RepID=A0A242N3P0_CABSO|nr:Signal transduction histidine kinase [Caballeronia sordidicola]OTP80295.1 Signal transduction histidine kinase [Caballeronia sordidicola]
MAVDAAPGRDPAALHHCVASLGHEFQ